MKMVADRQVADTRLFTNSDYYLPRDFVDRFAKGDTLEKAPPVGLSTDDFPDDPPPLDTAEEDPTAGVNLTDNNGLETCVRNWKAAAADEKKRTWNIFDETGIFASACRHGFILWIADMIQSGEL